MIHNDLQDDVHAQFTLSYELLCLLRWLIDHDAEKLKKVIKKAISSEQFCQEIKQLDDINLAAQAEDMQHSIIDFFGMLEALLLESMHEQVEKRARQKNLMPAVEQIDSTICDDATVRFSLEKTTSKIEKNPNINAKEQLFKELLKRWKPHKKNMLN
ncbi:MAG TPA: hypothetical protein PLU71_01525 [Candidatus Dependentiae bacterium]|nr:hypothetical protein [Candidatus Dependentiae bacterium]HRQ62512.1 hypothetical protein [Candidatus Dependentiae bacterium]